MMTDVKIVVAGIEMTPEQARKVHAELSKLFEPVSLQAWPTSDDPLGLNTFRVVVPGCN